MAWLLKDGENALGDTKWLAKILNGQNKIEDFIFNTPRKPGAMRKASASKISKERLGLNNPSNKNKPSYDIVELKKIAQAEWLSFVPTNKISRKINILKKLEQNFPQWSFRLSGVKVVGEKIRGNNKLNSKLAYILDIEIKELISIFQKDRSLFIKEKYKDLKFRAKMISFLKKDRHKKIIGFVSKKQRELFEMIKSIDSDAYLEHQETYGNSWKTYDIYSPVYNCFIEMHGRVWHDPSKTKPKLVQICKKNKQNDAIKRNLANTLGIGYCVFWDDEYKDWKNQIIRIFKKEPIDYEQAKSQANSRKKK